MPAPALRIPVTVDLGQFKTAMDEAGQRVHQEGEHIEGHFNSINKAAAGMALALTAAGGGITTALLSTVTALAKIGDLSDELRLPVNLIQALSVAATEARVPAETLTTALEKFTAASKLGGKDAEKFEKSLSNVGDSFLKAFKDADSQEERLKIISNALKSTTDEVKRAQLSLQAFGTDNERLIAVMGGGAASFDAYRENAARLGLEINESLVKQAQEAKSQLLLLSRVMNDEFTSAVGGLIPVLVRLLPYLQAIALAGQAVSSIFATDATASTKQLKDELDGLVDTWARLKTQRDALAAGDVSAADKLAEVVRQGLKEATRGAIDLTENAATSLKALDEQLLKVQERIETVKKLIGSKDAAAPEQKPAFEPREPLKEKDTSRDRFEAAADSIEKRTKALEAETKAIDDGTAAREKAKIAAQLLTVAEQINKEANVNGGKATAEQIEIIDRFSAAYGRAAAAIEQARSPLATFARDSANVGKALNQFAATSLDGMTNALADVVTGAKSAKDAFKSMADAILRDLARLVIRQSITGPIAGALKGLFPVGGGGAQGVVPGTEGAPGLQFGTGGFTGFGGRNEPAGFVHKGEYVFDQDAVNRIGVANLRRLQKGYADGGYVGQPSVGMRGMGGGGVVNNFQVIAPPGSTVTKEESRNSTGGVDIIAYIDSATAQNGARPGSQTNNMLRNGGVQQALARR